MHDPVTRRTFLRRAAAVAAAAPAAAAGNALDAAPAARSKSPNERLNLGVIGVAARGKANLESVASENIVALCDIDQKRLATARKEFPEAAAYEDFRRVLEHRELDAVVVSTPDHMHAFPVVWALRAGFDVYCEKPLAHSVREVRVIRDTAREKEAVTQLGTQIHAGDNYRRVVELIKAGVIGPVERVHVWQGSARPTPGKRVQSAEAPRHINYDLWLGPAPERPFHPSHFHFRWRWWWDFGGGVLADFGCHYMDLPHWALDLTAPKTIEAKGRKEYEGDNDVPSTLRVDYHYPARGEQPPVHLTWYHGQWMTQVHGLKSGVLFEGTGGLLVADYNSHQVFVSQGGASIERVEPWIPSSIGHHREWLEAVKTRGPTTCNFDYSGALAEAALLGNVAYRANEKLEWDAANAQVVGTRAADKFVEREYRRGWVL